MHGMALGHNWLFEERYIEAIGKGVRSLGKLFMCHSAVQPKIQSIL